jgi:hypothetical protein
MILKVLKTTINNDRGNVLMTALLLVFASSIIGATVVMLSSTDLKISGKQGHETQALFVAEAGLAEAVHRLGLANPTVMGGYNVAIGDLPPYDPDWKVYVQLHNNAPTSDGSTSYVGTLQDLSGEHLAYSVASGTDDVISIEHKWEDLDADGIHDADEVVRFDPSRVPPENFETGFPIDIVTVKGQSGQGERTLQADVTRQVMMTKAMGAFYTDKALEIKGNSAFCGWNHPVGIPEGIRPNECFAYHTGDGHLGGITTTGDEVKIKGGKKDIEGDPPVDDDATNPWYSLAELLGITQSQLNDLLAKPDFTAPADLMDGITYIQGDATLNAGMVGHGLIYITGNVTINGGFIYYGLIYIEGDAQITGTPWILGSVSVKGTADFRFTAGTGGVLYSAESIATYIGQLFPMQVLAWRDI